MKLKSNKSQLPKFYKVKQLKENSTWEFCGKYNFTENSIEIKKRLDWNQLKDKIQLMNSVEKTTS